MKIRSHYPLASPAVSGSAPRSSCLAVWWCFSLIPIPWLFPIFWFFLFWTLLSRSSCDAPTLSCFFVIFLESSNLTVSWNSGQGRRGQWHLLRSVFWLLQCWLYSPLWTFWFRWSLSLLSSASISLSPFRLTTSDKHFFPSWGYWYRRRVQRFPSFSWKLPSTCPSRPSRCLLPPAADSSPRESGAG